MRLTPEAARVPTAILFLILMIPFGASAGYLIVNLAFELAQRGVGATAIAGVIAVSYIPHTWRFLWAPLVDTTWTRKRWYVLGTAVCGLGVWAAGVICGEPHPSLWLLSVMQLVCNVGATLLAMAIESLMAATVPDAERGRTSGWFQAGNLGGQGLGGGLTLWLVQSGGWSVAASGAAMAAVFALCCLPMLALPDPRPLVALAGREAASATLGLLANARAVALDLWRLVRSRIGLLAMLICFLPIGSGASQNLWSAIAGNWHAGANLVALVNGVMSGLISAAGCVTGGWMCDRLPRRTAYCTAGALLVAVGVAMALMPRTPAQFALWTSAYAFVLGLCYTAYSAVVLEAIGRTAAATKYSLLAALSNMPIQGMTLVCGWSNDRWGTTGMLLVEAACGSAGIAVFLAVARVTRRGPGGGDAPMAASPPAGARPLRSPPA